MFMNKLKEKLKILEKEKNFQMYFQRARIFLFSNV